VLVNGEVTIEDDRETGRHAGRLLRHGTVRRRSDGINEVPKP